MKRLDPAGRPASVESLEPRALLTAADVDTSFGVNGTAATYVRIADSTLSRAVRQPDGKLLISTERTLTRLSPDGSTDLAFGENVRISANRIRFIENADLQPDGRIVVVGRNKNYGSGVHIARLNADGTLDTTFGTGGTMSVPLPDTDPLAPAAIHVDSLGRVVVYGTRYYSSSYNSLFVIRTTPAGVPDATFDGDGLLTLTYTDSSYAGDFVFQADNKPVFITRYSGTSKMFRLTATGAIDTAFGTAGYAALPTTGNISGITQNAAGLIYTLQVRDNYEGDGYTVVSRFSAAGKIDTTFATAGVSAFSLDNFIASGAKPRGLALDSLGRIAVVGTSRNLAMTVVRLTAAGRLDTTFDGDGRAFPVGNTNFSGSGLIALVDAADRIYAFGEIGGPGTIVRYTPAGTLDTTYNGTGIFKFAATVDTHDTPVATRVLAGGKLLTLSTVGNIFTLSRLSADGTRDNAFGIGGTVTASGHATDMTVLANGQFLVSLSSTVLRFNADGTPDTTFVTNGRPANVNNVGTYGIAVDSLGRIYLRDEDARLVRLLPGGTLDTSFAANGVLTTFANRSTAGLTRLIVQADDSVVFASAGFMYRVLTSGVVDTTWNNGVGYAIGSNTGDLRLGPDGKIYASAWYGVVNFTDYTARVWRTNPNGTPDTTYGVNGMVTLNLVRSGFYENINAIDVYADGTAVLAVSTPPTGGSGINSGLLVQLTPSGALDPAFGENGVLTVPLSRPPVDRGVLIDSSQRLIATGVYFDPAFVELNGDTTLTRFVGRSLPAWLSPGVGATYVLSGNTLSVTGGLIRFTSDAGLTTPGLAVTVADGAGVVFDTTQHLGPLTLNGTAKASMAGHGQLLRTTNLALAAAAVFDLSDNDLVLDYAANSPTPTVAGLIRSARAGGTWAGTGLSSSAARTNAAGTTTLGFLEASTYKSINGPTATFAGETIDDTAVLVRYTLYGDTDLDGGVSINDFNRLAGNFGVAAGKTWLDGDLDYDGGASINDFNLLAGNFGKTLPAVAPIAQVRKGIAPAKH